MEVNPQALELFHPLIWEWFRNTYDAPTDIQALSWPVIASGKHALISAPTGSGKTLCAFLWAIHQLASGAWPEGAIRVLYVSPLKALNNDIRKNLLAPLRQIGGYFAAHGQVFPSIRVLVRSGDTPQSERQRMLRRPPEILITTPESLNLLLSAPRAREKLTGIRTVILDEIHAIASDKRGTHLLIAVERLVALSGEFQRIALSATVRPAQRVAEFAGGFVLDSRGGEPVYRPREVAVIRSRVPKPMEVLVSFPSRAAQPGEPRPILGETRPGEDSVWPALVQACKRAIRSHRSTLLFTNTRRHAEKLARLINEGERGQLAYAHHGSLSREIRAAVERRLKRGQLQAIVATSSLELGIDIGELDQVVLIQTPITVASGLQRIGRAGHAVDSTSRGAIYPLHGRDILDAAIMARSILDQDIEEARPVLCPLDLLAQVILSMTGVERWQVDCLYDALRCSYPYRHLPRKQFDLVLEMLAGRYADSRIRELEPRVAIDRLEGTVQARRGALGLVYRSGGTIPDRGYFDLRLQDSRAKIGELDEEFVWERKVGDTFMLGTQSWKIQRIDHKNVEVVPWDGPVNSTPFWKAERAGRDFHFCARVAEFLERWNGRLDSPELRDVLLREYCLEEQAAEQLVFFLQSQSKATEADLPHRHHLLAEYVQDGRGPSWLRRVILHTLWGARVNQPLAIALAAAWEKQQGTPLEVFADDDCLLFLLPEGADLQRLFRQVKPDNLEPLLRRSLERSGFFGARFRESAGRALLLPRSDFRSRIPLWLTRLRSKKLLDAVLSYPDFPILVETWRTCLQDEFDLNSLRLLLEEIEQGQIRIGEARTPLPSPFARGVAWMQTNLYMYADDTLPDSRRSSVRPDILKEVLYSSRLRPQIDPELAAGMQEKLQRTAPGYAPRDSLELIEWLKERLVMPLPEWELLLRAIQRDHELDSQSLLAEQREKIVTSRLPGAVQEAVVAREMLPRVLRAVGQDPDPLPRLLAEWLRYYGPVDPQAIRRLFGIPPERLEEALAGLAEEGAVILDQLTRGAPEVQVCDAQNLETLLRLTRKGYRPSYQALSADHLPLFLAVRQGLVRRSESPGGAQPDSPLPGGTSAKGSVRELQSVLEGLFGYPAPAELWETEIFPARLSWYAGAWLDTLLAQSELRWVGCGRQRISFCFASDYELFAGTATGERRQETGEEVRNLLPVLRGKFSFWDIQEHSKLTTAETVRRLWQAAWQGLVTNDGFAALRRGIGTRFAASEPAEARPGRRGIGRRGYDRWKASRPSAGSWFALDLWAGMEGSPDAVEEEELAKDRVRQLLRRYGILFRELLERELPALRWPALFRALRIMELSGEVIGGYFFTGVSGLQFMSPAAFRVLEKGLPQDRIYWLCAQDPASPCGLNLPIAGLPPRLASNHLVFHGARLVLVSRRKARELELLVPAEDPHIPRYLELFSSHLNREIAPWKLVRVEMVNGEPARDSPYRQRLIDFGFLEEFKGLVLRARY